MIRSTLVIALVASCLGLGGCDLALSHRSGARVSSTQKRLAPDIVAQRAFGAGYDGDEEVEFDIVVVFRETNSHFGLSAGSRSADSVITMRGRTGGGDTEATVYELTYRFLDGTVEIFDGTHDLAAGRVFVLDRGQRRVFQHELVIEDLEDPALLGLAREALGE